MIFLFLLREILRYKIVNSQICQVFVIWLLLFLFSNQLESCRCNTCSYFYCLQLVGICLQAVAYKYAQTTAKQIIYLWKFVYICLHLYALDLTWYGLKFIVVYLVICVVFFVRVFHCFLWAFIDSTNVLLCEFNNLEKQVLQSFSHSITSCVSSGQCCWTHYINCKPYEQRFIFAQHS